MRWLWQARAAASHDCVRRLHPSTRMMFARHLVLGTPVAIAGLKRLHAPTPTVRPTPVRVGPVTTAGIGVPWLGAGNSRLRPSLEHKFNELWKTTSSPRRPAPAQEIPAEKTSRPAIVPPPPPDPEDDEDETEKRVKKKEVSATAALACHKTPPSL